MKNESQLAKINLEAELSTLKISLEEERSKATTSTTMAIDSAQQSGNHVIELSKSLGELKTKHALLLEENTTIVNREANLLGKAKAAIDKFNEGEVTRLQSEQNERESNSKAIIADSATKAAGNHISELEHQCAKLREELFEREKSFGEERSKLQRIQLQQHYSGDQSEGERAKRASLDEDEHTRNESREMATDIMASYIHY